MEMTDTINARGQVEPYFLNIRTGEKIPWERRHNTISYQASFSMASAFGGDQSYVPNRIGIIYGSSKTPSLNAITRQQSWDSLEYEMKHTSSDVQIQEFCYSPSLKEIYRDTGSSSSSSDIPGTAITFHAHSDDHTAGVWGSAGGEPFKTNMYIYQAVLLNFHAGSYRIIARASLANGSSYSRKPANFEVAVDWTIKFF